MMNASRIITTSFLEKAELEQQLKPNVSAVDYVELLECIWDELVGKAYSFVVKDKCGRLIGVALNFDANDEPEPTVVSELATIFEFLEFIEVPIKYGTLVESENFAYSKHFAFFI